LLTIGRDGRIMDVNRATELVTGYDRDHLVGSDFCDYFTEPDKAREGYRQVFADGTVHDYPLSIRHLSGPVTDVLYNATVYRNAAGEIEGVFAAARDITERKRIELELEAERQRFSGVLDRLPAYVVLLAADYTVPFANQFFRDRFGESGGRRCYEYLFHRDSPCEICESFKVLGDGQPRQWDWIGPDGHNYEIHDFLFRDAAGADLVLEMGIDVTERKRAEEALAQRTAELERSNKELQDFASIASHDLQEPLRKVMAFGDRLRAHCGAALDETGNDYLQRMQNAAWRMSSLIEALLEYSRVTTKAKPYERVDLNRVVAEVISDLEERIRECDARVDVGSLPAIMADRLQMRQLLQNLLANALKFHAPGVPPRVQVSATRSNGSWSIIVEDHGVGFDRAYADRIFRPFQRLHGRAEFPGSGMGLAICRKIVDRHRGTITARSRPGEGSVFTFTLPAEQQEATNDDNLEAEYDLGCRGR
jgi:PAS domain S-box-containing protein